MPYSEFESERKRLRIVPKRNRYTRVARTTYPKKAATPAWAALLETEDRQPNTPPMQTSNYFVPPALLLISEARTRPAKQMIVPPGQTKRVRGSPNSPPGKC